MGVGQAHTPEAFVKACEVEVSADAARAGTSEVEVKRAVDELMLGDRLQVEREEVGDEPNREG